MKTLYVFKVAGGDTANIDPKSIYLMYSYKVEDITKTEGELQYSTFYQSAEDF